MKTESPPAKSKAIEHRPIPSVAEQNAAFTKLGQKDQDNFTRQTTHAATKGGDALAAMWRRLAGVALGLATKPPKLSGLNTLLFFIPDGNYRKQVYAMNLSDTGVVTLFLPNIITEAVKAKLVTPVPKDAVPHMYTTGKGAERVVIEPYDRDSLNPQPYFKDMTGWNRKAIGIVLPADASETLIHTAEQLMALAATWPAPVPEPAK